MSEANKLETGEKYLSICLLGKINLAAFKNKNKKREVDPDYLGNGLAIWIKKKKESSEQSSDEL